jgi:hypothetical protein
MESEGNLLHGRFLGHRYDAVCMHKRPDGLAWRGDKFLHDRLRLDTYRHDLQATRQARMEREGNSFRSMDFSRCMRVL